MASSIAQRLGQLDDHVSVVHGLPVALRPATASAFMKLRRAALRDGIDLWPASGFRSFETQVRIWDQKWSGQRPLFDRRGKKLIASELSAARRLEAILAWSAPPGASRHHWGSDLDVYDRSALRQGYQLQLVPEEYGPRGPMAALGEWLTAHLPRYGVYRPYQLDRGGVQPEPWHLSHHPMARECSRALRVQQLTRALSELNRPWSGLLVKKMPDIYERFVRAVDHYR